MNSLSAQPNLFRCVFCFPAGDRLADSTITLALALELLSLVTTPPPLHPIPTWSPSRSNQKVDWMWPSPSGCWCTARYESKKHKRFSAMNSTSCSVTLVLLPVICQSKMDHFKDPVAQKTPNIAFFVCVCAAAGGWKHHRKGIYHKHNKQSL